MDQADERIERLRRWRASREPAGGIGDLVKSTLSRARRGEQRLAAFVDLWEAHLPAELAERTRVAGFRGGVAHVIVDSPATAYELDRRLRGWLERTLRREYPATLARVRLTVGEV